MSLSIPASNADTSGAGTRNFVGNAFGEFHAVSDRAAMRSRRAAAAAGVLVVCLLAALAVNPAAQAHAAELLTGTQEVSLDQLDASAEQLSAAQQAEAAAAVQPDAAVRPGPPESLSTLIGINSLMTKMTA